MIIKETNLKGAFTVDIEKREDERGFFARTFCLKELSDHGIDHAIVQANTSYNKLSNTLRGMHYQAEPHAEVKMVRCTKGAISDVIVDLRKNSPTYKQWTGVELTETNYRMLIVPAGFAHGFITLQDDTVVNYLVSEFYTPGAEKGIRWNDPAFGIDWPAEIKVISEKDRNWPDFSL